MERGAWGDVGVFGWLVAGVLKGREGEEERGRKRMGGWEDGRMGG